METDRSSAPEWFNRWTMKYDAGRGDFSPYFKLDDWAQTICLLCDWVEPDLDDLDVSIQGWRVTYNHFRDEHPEALDVIALRG